MKNENQETGKGTDGNKEKISAGSLLDKLKVHLTEENIVEDESSRQKGKISVKYFRGSGVNADGEEPVDEEQNRDSEALIEQIFDIEEEKEDVAEKNEKKALYEEQEAEKLRRSYEDADYDLMSIFGYLPSEQEEDKKTPRSKRLRVKPVPAVDLSDKNTVNAMRKWYRRRLVLTLLAAVGTAILFGVSLVSELSSVFGADMPPFMNLTGYPQVALLICIQVVILTVALQYRQFFSGIGNLFVGRFSPSQMFVLMTAAMLAYYSVLMIIGCNERTLTFNSVYTLCALASVIQSLMELLSEIHTFRIASSKNEKYVFVKPGREAIKDERRTLDSLVGKNQSYLALTKTRVISGYNGRTHTPGGKRKSIAYIGAFAVAFSVIFTIVAMFRGDPGDALAYGICALAFSAPYTVFFVFGHARLIQSRKLAAKGAAVIGEGSFDEYGKPANIIMTDREIFAGKGRIELLDIHGYGEINIDSALGYAAAVFTKLKCCLGDLFTNIATDYGVSDDVEIANVTEDGIEASVDGIGVMIGKYSYIKKQDMMPAGEGSPYETDELYLYIAVDGRTAVRICFKYIPSPDFINTIGKLLRKDSSIIIRTCDPNLNMKALEELMKIGRLSPVKIIKSETDIESVIDRSDAGIIASDGIFSLAKTLARSAKVRHAMNAGIVLSVISMIFGAAIIAALFAINELNAYLPFYTIIYQSVWIVAILLVDRLTI